MARNPHALPKDVQELRLAAQDAAQVKLDSSTMRLLREATEVPKAYAAMAQQIHAAQAAAKATLDSPTIRLLREMAEMPTAYAATIRQLQAVHEQFAPSKDLLRVAEAVSRLDYAAPLATAFGRLTRIADIPDPLAELGAAQAKWLKEAEEASARMRDVIRRASVHVDFTGAALTRLGPLELGAGLGLERYSHAFDLGIRTLASSAASLYTDTMDWHTLASLPSFVVERPPQELFVHVAGVEAITSIEADEDQPHTAAFADDAEAALPALLDTLDPAYVEKWRGARQALASRNSDRIAHVSVSIRELFRLVLHHVAPEEQVRAWSTSKDDFDRGRPTRSARFRFATRRVGSPAFASFLAKDFAAALELLTLFDQGVHEARPSLTDRHVRLMTLRMDQFLRFLIETSRETDS